MKRILYLAIATTIITSCKKDEVKTTPLTSINITNAVVGGTTAKLGSNATTISNNSYAQLAVVAGINSLYVYPVGDSAHPYYTNDKFTSNDREVYSLFLGGTPTATDAIMVKEAIPYRTDSTAGIRFINLANNNGALNVNLSTTPTVNEVSALAYKSLTEFKTYPGLYNSAPTFQVRKADGTLLTSFAFTTSTVPRFANVTLVIRPNATGVSVFRVNNDR
jgi:hypothetical protein